MQVGQAMATAQPLWSINNDGLLPSKKQARILHLRELNKVTYQTGHPHAPGTILVSENH